MLGWGPFSRLRNTADSRCCSAIQHVAEGGWSPRSCVYSNKDADLACKYCWQTLSSVAALSQVCLAG